MSGFQVVLGPLTDSESRRLDKYVEAARAGQRAQGKGDDPLRRVADVIVATGATGHAGGYWEIPSITDEDQLMSLREALVAGRTAHAIVAPDPESGLAEHLSWHAHGSEEHEHVCLRTRSGRVAMTREMWVRTAVLSRDEDIRGALNDYFFSGAHHEQADVPTEIDGDVPDDERWAADEPLLLADEWASIAYVWGDLEVRDRVNALFEEGERALGDEDDEDDEDDVGLDEDADGDG